MWSFKGECFITRTKYNYLSCVISRAKSKLDWNLFPILRLLVYNKNILNNWLLFAIRLAMTTATIFTKILLSPKFWMYTMKVMIMNKKTCGQSYMQTKSIRFKSLSKQTSQKKFFWEILKKLRKRTSEAIMLDFCWQDVLISICRWISSAEHQPIHRSTLTIFAKPVMRCSNSGKTFWISSKPVRVKGVESHLNHNILLCHMHHMHKSQQVNITA